MRVDGVSSRLAEALPYLADAIVAVQDLALQVGERD